MKLIIKREQVTMTGNRISGNTFPIREYIKAYLDGKWDGATKTWIVNVDKVNSLIERKAIQIDTTPEAAEAKSSQPWAVNTKYGRELGEDY